MSDSLFHLGNFFPKLLLHTWDVRMLGFSLADSFQNMVIQSPSLETQKTGGAKEVPDKDKALNRGRWRRCLYLFCWLYEENIR